jgi:predicted house-cleaning noncanonical NTP pyrophosphatase (MazG superfamily)|tara:strand:+ start:30736 stop:31041 length:306 start_codon:yes stop_codon:yes gene_type:complete
MKLVRDLIPRIIEDAGKTCKYHVADLDEYKSFLYEKMREELDEFIENPSYEEAADMYEVLSTILRLHSLTMFSVDSTATTKREKHGGFRDRIILEEVNDKP